MKSSFLASVGLHALALAIAFISFDRVSKPLENNLTEALPITLVNISDKTSLQEGDKTKSLTSKPAPKPTKKPQIKPDAKNVGDGKVDVATPLKPQEKPRETNAPPPVLGKLNAKSDEVQPQDNKVEEKATEKPVEPKPTPAEPKPAPAEPKPTPVEPKPTPVEPKPTPVEPKPTPVEPKPAPVEPKPTPVEQKPTPAEPKPEKPVQQDDIAQLTSDDALAPKIEDVKPKEEKTAEETPTEPEKTPKPKSEKQAIPDLPKTSAPLPSARPQPPEKPNKRSEQETKKAKTGPTLGEEVADLIKENTQKENIDRTRTQGGGAKRSEGNASLGGEKNIGNVKEVSASLEAIIKACMDGKWTKPAGFEDRGRNLKILTKFELNPSGEIVGQPEFSVNGGDQYEQQQLINRASIALNRCAPFKDFPQEYYETIWHYVSINFDPNPNSN